jgi:hypothetical protein
MSLSLGDFVYYETNFIKGEGVIIDLSEEKDIKTYLISIPEYNGDYKWIKYNNIKRKLDLSIENKLSTISNFGDWWYGFHKSIYQKLLIEAILN